MAADGVLGGIKVVDLSEQVPGPYATRLLAGLGADVIKVERPDSGDRLRHRPAMFEAENRGKRDLSVDLKSADGRAALLRVIASADVLVETYRPGVMDRLGLGFDAVLQVNPRIVYLSISGYGATGPYRDLPGHDFQYLSFAGAIPPPKPAFAADYVPLALRLGKAALNESEPLPVQEGYAVEQQYTLRLARSADSREALAARREKRPPRFTGQ